MSRPRASGIPDWTDAAGYAPLLQIERAGFAWEWLRRDPAYRTAAHKAFDRTRVDRSFEDRRALEWNLHAFEDPDLAAPVARPVWAAVAHPWVLPAAAARSVANADAVVLAGFEPFARLVHSPGGDRLLLSDGYRSIRLDLSGDSIGDSPVRLSFELSGIEALERPLIVLRRLRSLIATGRFAGSLHPTLQRASRLILLLRAHDAIRAGARQIDIAEMLSGSGLERSRWRVHSPSMRSRAQRLVGAARHMARSQFWKLLD